MPTHTVYRPASLKGRYPVVLWGNGSCVNSNFGYREFLAEIASHGFIVLAIGPYRDSPAPRQQRSENPAEWPPFETRHTQMLEALDWITAESRRQGSPYYEHVVVDKVAAMGHSCGGLQTVRVSTDPRISTAVVLNSGMITDEDQYMIRHGVKRSILTQMHAPIAYFIGGETDIAWANAEVDWKELQALRIPAINANMDVGHGATYHLPNGGPFTSGPLAWLKWQLKADPAARAMFVGDRCGFCSGDTWKLRRHLLAASAQEAGMRAGGPGPAAAPAISSPTVADGRVTFRLRAPAASTVTVSGDFGPDAALARGGDGVWSATVGPLKPEVYVYYFNVDGVRMTDPSNPQVKIGYVTSTTTNIVTVPGNGPAFYDVQDVPHGEIRTLLYKSRSNNAVRELNVYLPPGYDANQRRRYPVLYLLHGFANDHHSWHRYGRANDILDNLLANQAIKPFIVVMPLGYGGAAVNGDGTGIPPSNAGAFGGDFALYEKDILEDIVPLIDGRYRTLANRANRAIVGFSMGGMQAGRFGLGNLDTFSHVGIMSAGLVGNPASTAAAADPIATLAGNAAAANKQLKLLWIACGVEDTAMAGARSTHEALQKAGIRHTFLETEGAHHWRVWRHYLHDLAPLLFR